MTNRFTTRTRANRDHADARRTPPPVLPPFECCEEDDEPRTEAELEETRREFEAALRRDPE